MTYRFARMFLEIQKCVIPRCAEFSDIQQQESLRILNHFLEQKSRSTLLRLRFFFVLIQAVSLLSSGSLFQKLPSERKMHVLQFFFDSRIALLRKGFWGVNTLARMSVYGQPSVYREINYHLRPQAEINATVEPQ